MTADRSSNLHLVFLGLCCAALLSACGSGSSNDAELSDLGIQSLQDAPPTDECAQLTALVFEMPDPTLSVGQSAGIPVMGRYTQGSDRAVSTARVASSDPAIASVSADGLVSALLPGSFTLTANACGLQQTLQVAVVSGFTPRKLAACQSLVDDIAQRTSTQASCFAAPGPTPDCSAFDAARDTAMSTYAVCLGSSANADCSAAKAALKTAHNKALQCSVGNGPPDACSSAIMAVASSCQDLSRMQCTTDANLPTACQ